MIRRVLVPIDITEFSNLAVRYALLFQKVLGSKITLMYAEEFSFLFQGELPIGYYLENVPEAKAKAGDELRRYAREHVPAGMAVNTLIVDEVAHRGIVMAAEDAGADLIIMGTHGRHGLRRAILGSVTESVLRNAKCPVLTVNPALFPVDREVAIGTIFCPVDFTAAAWDALHRACELAYAFDAQLVVLHLADPGDTSEESVEQRFHLWVDPRLSGRTRYEFLVAGGDVSARILERAERAGADLIVTGTRQKELTRFAPQPVLTVGRTEQAALAAVPDTATASSDRPARAAHRRRAG